MIIVIPSRHASPTPHMLESAQFHFNSFGKKSVVLALGSDRLSPWYATEAVLVVPLPVLRPLLNFACLASPRMLKSIFGLDIPRLGFGGSSNVTQLIGLLSGHPWWIKLDDDCRIFEFDAQAPPDGAVGAGIFHESVPHPKDLLIAAYPQLSAQLRLNNAQWVLPVPTLKNGALLMSSAAAAQAPYPVIHSAKMRVSVRGEVYDWVGRILDFGISVVACPGFRVRHYRSDWSHNEWITQLMLKADIVFSSRARRDGIRLSEQMRHQNLVSALANSRDLLPSHFAPVYGSGDIYREALALSARAAHEQSECELSWRSIASRADELRRYWIKQHPILETSLFPYV